VPVTPELVPVEDLIGAALQQVASVAAGRELRVHLPPAGALLVGRLDFVLTLRALVNVLENALRYSSPDTAVDVHARRDGTRLHIEVADRGPGIAPADRARVFEPFQRGAAAGGVPGTGLGLPIARRLVEAQDGTLELAARAGGGSVFTLTLPAAEVGALTDASL
jgi:two-component system sensor histidine kinase KdpD